MDWNYLQNGVDQSQGHIMIDTGHPRVAWCHITEHYIYLAVTYPLSTQSGFRRIDHLISS